MKKILSFILMCTLVVAPMSFTTEDINAATSKKVYKYKTVDKSETFTGKSCTIKVDNYYKRVVLKGKTKAIKKINKSLKSYSKKFFKKGYSAKEYAANDVDYKTNDYVEYYEDCANQNLSYKNKKYVSIAVGESWYAGGVSNITEYGYTYSLKTGKQIKNIKKFTKLKSLTKIKNALKAMALEADPGYDVSEIDNMKATEFNFYLDESGNVVVCFPPYSLGYGGWTKKFTLKGKIK